MAQDSEQSAPGLVSTEQSAQDEASGSPESRRCLILFALTSVLLVCPLLFSGFPPGTDLPQHLTQSDLHLSLIRGGDGVPFDVRWLPPNILAHALLTSLRAVLPPVAAAKVFLALIIILWNGAAFFAAAFFRRSPWAAVLAAPLVFNLQLYWGFYSFLLGWPFFVLWLALSVREPDRRLQGGMVVLSLLLFSAHALWFLTAAAWLVLHVVVTRPGVRSGLLRLSVLVPVGIWSAVWFFGLSSQWADTGFNMAPAWAVLPWMRVMPGWLVESLMGGVRGTAEPAMLVAVLLWIGGGCLTERRNLRSRVQPQLLLCAGLFLAAWFLAPDKYTNTIYFSQRWFPPAVVLLLLAVPPPCIKAPRLLAVLPGVLVFLFLAITTLYWRTWDQRELSGLDESLESLPAGSSVVGLDFIQESDLLKGRPFLHVAARATVLKNARTDFTFAWHASSAVRLKDPRTGGWNGNLIWSAHQVSEKDLRAFEYALIQLNESGHAAISTLPHFTPVTMMGRWRLYRINHDPGRVSEDPLLDLLE